MSTEIHRNYRDPGHGERERERMMRDLDRAIKESSEDRIEEERKQDKEELEKEVELKRKRQDFEDKQAISGNFRRKIDTPNEPMEMEATPSASSQGPLNEGATIKFDGCPASE